MCYRDQVNKGDGNQCEQDKQVDNLFGEAHGQLGHFRFRGA